ncbi:glycosyltransferase family 2 protein [Vagococcus fluvialis]|uniref:glycosyltransferase family 2 protein n=1 Tax=Vagococcus fluvialis TaxID=2738 RepID=UPI003B5C54FF
MFIIISIDLVIVTYGDRWTMLERVIERMSLVNEVKTITIANNNSNYDVKKNIEEYKFNKNIEVVDLLTNEGSSGGFFEGIQSALKKSSQFIMLLDDDTYINEEGIYNILKDIEKEEININENIFSFNRPSWIKNGDVTFDNVKNSFFEFSIRNKKKRIQNNDSYINFIYRPYVPYAGLIFDKSLIDSLSKMPDRDYFLYVDDSKFTHNLVGKSGNIFCYQKERIYELEESWAQKENKSFFEAYFYCQENDLFRAKYNIRNRSNFEINYLVTNKVIYFLNKYIYLSYVLMFYMPKNIKSLKRFKEILKLLKLGKKGYLGKKDKL